MTSANPAWDAEIDVSADICPMTYVRTRLAMERLLPGQRLRVTLRGVEARWSVPQAARMQGHQIVSDTLLDDGRCDIVIRKTGGSAAF